MNYYPHHIGDYARDTAHLSMLEDAAYRRMMDLYYATEQPLPGDKVALYRFLRARSKEERRAVDVVLQEFFTDGPTGWIQGRCELEIERSKQRVDAAKRNGKSGGRPQTQWKPSGNPVGSQPETQREANQNQKPKTKSQEPKKNKGSAFALPDWVPPDAWAAWLEMRSAKQAKNTDFALNLAVKRLDELRGQGFAIRAVIEQSVLRSWTTFYPLKSIGAGTPNRQESLEERNRKVAEGWVPPELRTPDATH